MKLSTCIEKFIQDRVLRCYTEKTVRNYRETLSVFLRQIGDIDVESLSADDLDSYSAWLVGKKLSKASVGSYMRQIKAFINWAIKESIIVSDDLIRHIRVPKAPKRQIVLFTPDDMRLVFESVQEESEWLRARDKLIIALMYDSGLRQAEVCKIMYKDIDSGSHVLLVHGKGDKDRLVPFGSFSEKLLQVYVSLCPYSADYLMCDRWGKQLSENAIKKMMSKLKARTGLDGLSSHKLRHNFATNYCIDGYRKDGFVDNIKLKTIMGHDSLETTEKYIHEAAAIISTSDFRSHLDGFGWAS